MEYYLQQLVNGICLGGMYALMSVGYSLVYSIMNFSNFAHGGVIMVGAYVGYFALTALGCPFLVTFLLCGVAAAFWRSSLSASSIPRCASVTHRPCTSSFRQWALPFSWKTSSLP